MKPQLLLALLFGCLLAARPAGAQLPARAAFASDEAMARHQAAFAAVVRKAGLRTPAATYYKYRIDVTKEDALRRAGFDLRAMDGRIRIDGPGSFQESSLFADVVVRGTVLSLVTDSSRGVCYHSAYRVRVAETWQGKANTIVTVRLFSGPSGNSNVNVSESPKLQVGEDAILHLRYVDFTEDEEAKKRGLVLCANNAVPGDFGLLLASTVRGDEVLDHYGQRPLAKLTDLRRQLQRIAAILDKEHFYQKAF
ncbi:hypothetical protein MON38_09975 [Hymenobacter sp. DH14]|uniref:DUF4468 domain-containing protein n=1 Tax=Hymenobacter cyanobacteriorum TaxID=2926463 RepID=A0A9X2AGK1_9BACT|nr:hypothetical protein [Hymenobacter cyanobacteriorum]MCI1187748.1 hypothetical protein [Hymenobacter cyanobacteriorum]